MRSRPRYCLIYFVSQSRCKYERNDSLILFIFSGICMKCLEIHKRTLETLQVMMYKGGSRGGGGGDLSTAPLEGKINKNSDY